MRFLRGFFYFKRKLKSNPKSIIFLIVYKFKIFLESLTNKLLNPFLQFFSFHLTVFLELILDYSFLMEDKGFNMTQGMALLLLKPLNLPANYVLNLIIYITNPSNNIGY